MLPVTPRDMLPSTKLTATPSVPTETIVPKFTDTQPPPPQTCTADSGEMKKLIHVPDSMNSIEIPMTGCSVQCHAATSAGKGLFASFAAPPTSASVLVESSQEAGATIKPSSILSKTGPTTQEMMQVQTKTRAASRALNGILTHPCTPRSTAATQPAKRAPQKILCTNGPAHFPVSIATTGKRGQPSDRGHDRGHELDPVVESSPSGGGCSHNGIVACVALAMLLFCVVQTAVLGPGGSIARRGAFDVFDAFDAFDAL